MKVGRLCHDAQFPIDLCPVPNCGSPLLCGFKDCQIQGSVTREDASFPVQLPIGRIQRFYGVCRINDLPDSG